MNHEKEDVLQGPDGGCSSEWVRVFDGNTELLQKTCNANAQLDNNMTATVVIKQSISTKITVFFKTRDRKRNDGGTGFNLTRTIVLAPKLKLSSDQCLWDCTWRPNPFFRAFKGWNFRQKYSSLNW